ncbi:perilipin-2-like isoform X2 [Vanacampus margaritifer]
MSLNKQTAASRVAQLPLVRSAYGNLSVLYGETKSINASLKSVCEGLESGVTLFGSVAVQRVSPVITKLKPQVSFANDVACKSLDWLEATFPVLHTPTDQLVAGVRSKVLEVQDAVNIVAHGTVDCVQHAVTCMMAKVQQPVDQSLVERAVSASNVGLDSALNISEALVDRMLPPTEEEKKEEVVLVEDSQAAAFESRYSVRLMTLSITLCRRTIQLAGAKIHSAQIMEALSTNSGQRRILQSSWLALTWSLEQLPLHVQQQIVSTFFYFTEMYNLRAVQQSGPKQDGATHLRPAALEATPSPYKGVKNNPRANSNWRARRPASTSLIESRSTSLAKVMGSIEKFH